MQNIYVGHPVDKYPNSPAECVNMCLAHPEWYPGWQLRPKPYQANASLNINDFCSAVLQAQGPVVLLQRVQNTTFTGIRGRLGSRVPVLLDTITTAADLQRVIANAIDVFTRGEPLLPLDMVVALLLMRKLDREHMWTGNAKGYMWVSDLPKGRGLDIKYEPRVANVLNILLMQGIVVYKTSNSKKKYALNPERREEIYKILKDRKFPLAIENVLLRNPATETVRALDLLDYDDNQP